MSGRLSLSRVCRLQGLAVIGSRFLHEFNDFFPLYMFAWTVFYPC